MNSSNSFVFIVDDDGGVCAALESLLRSVGHQVLTFGSASEFLARAPKDVVACLVLDIRLPDISGLDLQHELSTRKPLLPIVFITGYADIPMTIRALQNGAVAFLPKPFGDNELIDAVDQALRTARTAYHEHTELDELRGRFACLTAREYEVYKLVVTGMLNKQIAAELGIREVTVKIHRAHVMHKTGAGSVAELVRMSERLGVLTERLAVKPISSPRDSYQKRIRLEMPRG